MSAEERILFQEDRLVGHARNSDLADLGGESDAMGDDREAAVTIQAECEESNGTLLSVVLDRPRVDNGSAVHTKEVIHITDDVLNIVRHLDNSPYYANLVGAWIHFRGFGV